MTGDSSAARAVAATKARIAIDAAHDADLQRNPDGRAAERVYAERIEEWIGRLMPEPGLALRLAACCQHLERWAVPRGDFPKDRAGYLAWRKAVQARQGIRAREILIASGLDVAVVERIAKLVAKQAPRGDSAAQALEDAACLVFLGEEVQGFLAEHKDYAKAKVVDILRKTWAKMSPRAKEFAKELKLPPAVKELVAAAAG